MAQISTEAGKGRQPGLERQLATWIKGKEPQMGQDLKTKNLKFLSLLRT